MVTVACTTSTPPTPATCSPESRSLFILLIAPYLLCSHPDRHFGDHCGQIGEIDSGTHQTRLGRMLPDERGIGIVGDRQIDREGLPADQLRRIDLGAHAHLVEVIDKFARFRFFARNDLHGGCAVKRSAAAPVTCSVPRT